MDQKIKVVVAYGDSLLRQEYVSGLISSRFGVSNSLVDRFDSLSAEELSPYLFSPPLFASLRIIVVNEFDLTEDMEKLFDRVSKINYGDRFWILVIDEDDMRKGKSFSSKIKKIIGKDSVHTESFSRCSNQNDVVNYVEKLCSEEFDLKINKQAVSLLADLCGFDYRMIRGEIEKLALITDGRTLSVKDVSMIVQQVGDSSGFLQFYTSILYGNIEDSLSSSREVIDSIGPEPVFACIMKVAEAAVIISHAGGTSSALSFANKKRSRIDQGVYNGFLWRIPLKSTKSKPPTPFLYKTADKVVSRMKCREHTLSLYSRCYDSYVKFRTTSDLSVASARINELLIVMCRGITENGNNWN